MDINGKEWFIEVPWGKLALVAWGDSRKPPVLLVHGRQDSAATFTLLIKYLPKDYYYVGIDLPGNGKSDSFPKGLPLTTYDFTAVLVHLVRHFRWKHFIYIGHSLGGVIGKYFMLSHPGVVTKCIDLDPSSAYEPYEAKDYPKWFDLYYESFYDWKNYKKFASTIETAPRITYKQALDAMQEARGLSDEATPYAVDRNIVEAGDGLYKFVFDQRMKQVVRPPIPRTLIKDLYKSLKVPTLTLLPSNSVKTGWYDRFPFLFEESDLDTVQIVEANHDLHLNQPKIVAQFISEFLLDVKKVRSKI